SEDAGRFEFRFFHFTNASLAITEVELEWLSGEARGATGRRRWRMLGRLQKSWIGFRGRDGGVTVSRAMPAGCLLYGGWPYLRLARGHYRLTVRVSGAKPRDTRQAVLGIEVFADSRWRRGAGVRQLSRFPESDGIPQVQQDFTAAEIACGTVSVDFSVPTDLALETGADAPLDMRLHHYGNAALRIAAVDLVK